MSATTVFDLRAILASSIQTAIDLARQSEDVTVDQVMDRVMASVNIQEIHLAPVKVKNSRAKKSASTSDSESEPKEPTEKIERVRAAPAKPRAIPDDETRCCARSLYEKDHLEGGKLKVMRDEEDNLYGDRCKFKKVGEVDFCKHHSEKQPLGVWGGEYSGKFQVLVEKLSAPQVEKKPKAAEDKPKAAEDKPKAAEVKPKVAEVKPKAAEVKPKKAAEDKPKVAADKPKKTESKPKAAPEKPVCKLSNETISDDEDDEPVETISDDEDEPVVAKPKAAADKPKAAEVKPKAAEVKPIAPEPKPEEEEEEALEVEECQIEGKTYLRDAEDNIYDEDDNLVGKYNFKTKKWIKRF